MNTAENTAQNTIQNAQERAKDGVRLAAKKAEQAVDGGGEFIQHAVSRASEIGATVQGASAAAIETAQTKAQDAYDTLLEEGKKTADRLEKDIRTSPFTAVGLAFLGGVVLTSLLKR